MKEIFLNRQGDNCNFCE